MRVRFVSFCDFVGVNDIGSEDPAYLTIPNEGVQQSPLVIEPFRYPRVYTPDELAEFLYRFRVIEQTISWSATTPSFTETGTATINWGNASATNEGDILDFSVGNFDTWGPLSGSTNSYTRSPGGPSGPFDLTSNPAFIWQRVPNTGNGFKYDSSAELFLPRIAYVTGALGCIQQIVNVDESANPAYGGAGEPTVILDDIDFFGEDMSVSVILPEGSTAVSITSSFTPITWWEYRDNANLNPIWDAATGAQLEDFATLEN